MRYFLSATVRDRYLCQPKKYFSMRTLLTSFFLIGLSSVVLAQSPIGMGGRQLNLGVGLYDSRVPLYGGMDFGVHQDITVGPQFGLDLRFDYITIAGRGDYHFNTLLNIPRDWDFYAGLTLGFAAGVRSSAFNGLDLGLQLGGRYYWNSSWGVNLEFGGGVYHSGARVGVSKRL